MFCVDSIRRSVFLVQICRLFELLTRFIHIMTLFAVPGCVYMLKSVFFLNVEVFGVHDPSAKGFASFLSEMWSLFLRIGSGLACDSHRVYRFTHLESKSVARCDTLL